MNSIRCSQCKHYIEANAGEGKIYGCDRSKCVFEPTTKNDSSELEKNSKKLEKDFGELDCISRADAIKAMQNKAKKLTNEDIINGLCGAVAILYEMPSVTPQLSVSEVTALAEWTEKLTKASEDAYNKGYEAGRKELEPITSKDKFIYALTACGCLLKDGKTWYEHNELIKCFEDLGLFEQEPQTFKWCTDCKEYDQEKHCCHRWSKVIRNTVEEIKQEQESILDKLRAEIEGLTYYWCETNPKNVIDDVLEIIDKYKAEQE